MFYRLMRRQVRCQDAFKSEKDASLAAIVQRARGMDRAAPGQCAGCGGDAYIQLANQAGMVCARCYAQREDFGKSTGDKGGEREPPPLAGRRPDYELATARGRTAGTASRRAAARKPV